MQASTSLRSFTPLLEQSGSDSHVQDIFQWFHIETLRTIEASWERVLPMLCDDAPEGYELDGDQDEGTVGTKDTLSWAWRGLKESR